MIRTVRLDEETNDTLERKTQESGETPSQLIRRAIREVSPRPAPRPAGRSVYERVKHLIGTLDGGTGAAAERRRKATSSRATGKAFAALLAKEDRKRGNGKQGARGARNSSKVYADMLVEKHEARQRKGKGRQR